MHEDRGGGYRRIASLVRRRRRKRRRNGCTGGEGGGRDERGESKTLRERENNALKQQPATTLIGHFVHLFDLFKLWDN